MAGSDVARKRPNELGRCYPCSIWMLVRSVEVMKQVQSMKAGAAKTVATLIGLGVCTALLAPAAGFAQVVSRRPMFTNVVLSPRFAPDPTLLRGISGGELAIQEVSGRFETETGPCIGFVSERPDHKIKLESFFDYLNVEVLSAQDTVMLVKGPGGTWCSDNRTAAGSSIAGQWLPGRYEVWIGTIQPDSYVPYSLKITEVQ